MHLVVASCNILAFVRNSVVTDSIPPWFAAAPA